MLLAIADKANPRKKFPRDNCALAPHCPAWAAASSIVDRDAARAHSLRRAPRVRQFRLPQQHESRWGATLDANIRT
jgi:hypothetical protein